MRYSFVATDIDTRPSRTNTVVSEPVIRARESVRLAIQSGSPRDIDAAYARLEQADKIASMRRASAHALRRVSAILGDSDPAWNKLVGAVAGFRGA